MTRKRPAKSVAPARRAPTEPEEKAIAAARTWLSARYKESIPPPSFTGGVDASGTLDIHFEHSDPRGATTQLCQALATRSADFAERIVHQLANLPGVKAAGAVVAVNEGLQFIAANRPQNEVETLLLTQMWAAHLSTMAQFRRLGGVETIQQLNANGVIAAKMGNLSIRYVEALAKLRSGGKQEVTVVHEHRHIYVAPGGQAIVGDVYRGTGGEERTSTQSHVPGGVPGLTFAPGATVWGEDQGGVAMSGAEDPREEALLSTRGECGSAFGQTQRALPDGPLDQRNAACPSDAPCHAPGQSGRTRLTGSARHQISPSPKKGASK